MNIYNIPLKCGRSPGYAASLNREDRPRRKIKYKPENSIVKYQPGDEIKLKQEDFVKLSKAFFAEIESKYL